MLCCNMFHRIGHGVRSTNQLLSLRQLATSTTAKPDLDTKDVFGTLSVSGQGQLSVSSAEKSIPDDPDGYDVEQYDIEPRKNAYYYKYEIGKWARQGSTGLRKALELFHEMKSKARIEPTVTNFSPLIYGCAKAGYTKRAFELYEESLKYINKPTNSNITSLINACAESPFPEYGLKRLEWFLTHLKVNFTHKVFNEIHYNSAIKAYGKLGRLDEASKLVQQMIENNVYPTIDTFNMLLIGCASNKEAGCSLALRVYKRMKLYDLKPNGVTYRLLLRCIRDCEMGSRELIQEIFRELPAMTNLDQRLTYKKKMDNTASNSSASRRRNLRANFEWAPLITDLASSVAKAVNPNPGETLLISSNEKKTSSTTETKSSIKNELIPVMIEQDQRFSDELIPTTSVYDKPPNLLVDDHLELMQRIEALQIDKLKYNSNRMMLFGGLRGYIEVMLENGCKPDNKTFTLLLDCIEMDRNQLIEYHKLAKQYNIQRDRLYYDKLIERVCQNKFDKERLELGLHFLEQMQQDNEKPHISTFESLARGCRSWSKAKQLLNDLKRSGFIVSDKMIREFFCAALINRNFHYLNRLINLSREKKFKPTRMLVDKLEEFRLVTHELMLKQEKNSNTQTCDSKTWTYNENQIKEFDTFTENLGSWLGRVEIQEDEHPWSQFKVDDRSKSEGYINFVKHFKALNQVKREALERGGTMSNLDYKARQLAQLD